MPEEREKAGQDLARRYLEALGADVLIWGEVIRVGDKSSPRLSLTTSRKRQWGRYACDGNLNLPVIFWEDLVKVLHLLVMTQAAEFDASQGHYVADRLRPFSLKVRRMLEGSEERQGWNADARASARFILATSLTILGEQAGERQFLLEAVAAYREALKERTRERVPLGWAMTQHNLGTALSKLGEWEGSGQRLEEAEVAYREALKERTRERVPLDWAMTQHNLGSALRTLGEIRNASSLIGEAVSLHLSGWEVFADAATAYASIAFANVTRDIAALQRSLAPQAFQDWLKGHEQLFARLRQIGALA